MADVGEDNQVQIPEENELLVASLTDKGDEMKTFKNISAEAGRKRNHLSNQFIKYKRE
jgi:hypothetical protein